MSLSKNRGKNRGKKTGGRKYQSHLKRTRKDNALNILRKNNRIIEQEKKREKREKKREEIEKKKENSFRKEYNHIYKDIFCIIQSFLNISLILKPICKVWISAAYSNPEIMVLRSLNADNIIKYSIDKQCDRLLNLFVNFCSKNTFHESRYWYTGSHGLNIKNTQPMMKKLFTYIGKYGNPEMRYIKDVSYTDYCMKKCAYGAAMTNNEPMIRFLENNSVSKDIFEHFILGLIRGYIVSHNNEKVYHLLTKYKDLLEESFDLRHLSILSFKARNKDSFNFLNLNSFKHSGARWIFCYTSPSDKEIEYLWETKHIYPLVFDYKNVFADHQRIIKSVILANDIKGIEIIRAVKSIDCKLILYTLLFKDCSEISQWVLQKISPCSFAKCEICPILPYINMMVNGNLEEFQKINFEMSRNNVLRALVFKHRDMRFHIVLRRFDHYPFSLTEDISVYFIRDRKETRLKYPNTSTFKNLHKNKISRDLKIHRHNNVLRINKKLL